MDADAFESDAPVQIERMLMKPSDMDSAVVTRTTTKFRPQGGATYGENVRTIQFRMSCRFGQFEVGLQVHQGICKYDS